MQNVTHYKCTNIYVSHIIRSFHLHEAFSDLCSIILMLRFVGGFFKSFKHIDNTIKRMKKHLRKPTVHGLCIFFVNKICTIDTCHCNLKSLLRLFCMQNCCIKLGQVLEELPFQLKNQYDLYTYTFHRIGKKLIGLLLASKYYGVSVLQKFM